MLNAVVFYGDGTIEVIGSVDMPVVVKCIKAALPQLSQIARDSLTSQLNDLQDVASDDNTTEGT